MLLTNLYLQYLGSKCIPYCLAQYHLYNINNLRQTFTKFRESSSFDIGVARIPRFIKKKKIRFECSGRIPIQFRSNFKFSNFFSHSFNAKERQDRLSSIMMVAAVSRPLDFRERKDKQCASLSCGPSFFRVRLPCGTIIFSHPDAPCLFIPAAQLAAAIILQLVIAAS